MSKDKSIIMGFDIGTGNLVSSVMDDNEIEINNLRNCFTFVSDSQINSSEIANSKLDYVTQYEDGEVLFHAILGNDSLILSNLFGKEVQRPMKRGVISSDNIDSIDIITLMLKKLIGRESVPKGSTAVFSIPAMPVDDDEASPVSYHEMIFKQIFKSIGFDNVMSLNEAMAINYANCAKENFSSISISFGAGMANVVVSYKNTEVMKFSVCRSGDWVDEFVSKSTGVIANKVTAIKEKPDMNLLMPVSTTNKKERTVRQAICFAYQQLIEYILEMIVEEIKHKSELLEINDEIPIIISGGTSLINGFVDVFKEQFSQVKNFPFDISEIRQAEDPLSDVSKGCMIYGHWVQKKEEE